MIGKWHLGFCSWSYTPRYRGFDSFYGIYLGAGDHYTHETARILDLHDNETPVENKDGVYSTYLYAEVCNNNSFLFIIFFRLAISPTWSYGEKKCSTFHRKKIFWILTVDCHFFFYDKCMRAAEMKSSEERSSQWWTQFMQLRKRSSKKLHDFNGICTRDLAIPLRRSNQLSYEATDVGSRSCVRYREVTGSNPVEVLNFFQASLTQLHKLRSQLSGSFFTWQHIIVD